MKKSAPDSAFIETALPDPIAQGDAAASQGDWPLAISFWESALHGTDQDKAASRLRWFLVNSAAPVSQPSFRKSVLLITIACAVLGTALVFLAQNVSGTSANALAIAAWACYVASAVGAVVYAWRTGTSAAQPRLDASALQQARDRARSLAMATEPLAPDVRR